MSDATEQGRNLNWDIAALALAAVAIFVWACLLSFDPADPLEPMPSLLAMLYQPDQLAFPSNPQIANRCGFFGALTAQILIQAFGGGAYVVAGLFSLGVIVMLRQKPLASPLGRSLGWTIALVSLLTLFHFSAIELPLASTFGPGGAVGAMTANWINSQFAITGGVIIALCCLAGGLMLSTEYAIFRGISFLTIGVIVISKRLGLPIATAVKTTATLTGGRMGRDSSLHSLTIKEKPQPIVELVGGSSTIAAPHLPPVQANGTSDGPPIRIGGKGNDKTSIVSEDAINPQATADDQATKESPRQRGRSITASVGKLAGKLTGRSTTNEDTAEQIFVENSSETSESTTQLLQVDGEEIIARVDEAHNGSELKIRTRKDRPNNQGATSFLETLDDTKLPEGSAEYILPGLDLLTPSEEFSYEEQMVEIRRKAVVLEHTFKNFGFNVRVVEIETGPVIAQYEIELEAGLRLSKITSLADDIAIALRVPSVRIVAPIPGKNTVGIEVPNQTRQIVRMREVIEETGDEIRKMKIPLFLGKDVSGKSLAVDLATMPHLLIAGRTGTGKSVCLNTIITSMLMTRRPDEVRLLMIDPKMVELSGYAQLPHLMHPVVTDMQKAEAILAWAVDKMEERYRLLARAGVRHLASYNQLDRQELLARIKPQSSEEESEIPEQMPYIVIVADEIADMMMTAGKEVEQHIIRLAQKSRAVGIHLILATQKPTVDVITGLIKSNLPARISFQVASRTDSRVVLDEMGADKLLGNGDMLFLWPGTSMLLRGQGTYLGDDEINRVVAHCSQGEQNFVQELMHINVEKDGDEAEPEAATNFRKRDELYEAAVDVVVREGRGSCSLLQRALGIGYGRAARLIDFMAEDQIVGQYNGSQARDVLMSVSQWEATRNGGSGEAEVSEPVESTRKNTIRRQDDGWGEQSAKVAAGVDEEESEDWEE